MNVAIGNDHRGFKLKQVIVKILSDLGYSYQDFGSYDEESVDYPDIAREVARAVANGSYDRGILICSTGIGMCIAANKVNGIRAALCYDNFCTTRARQHNDANILCLGGEVKSDELAGMIRTFMTVEFDGGRHQRRLDKIKAMEDSIADA
jgi:ribose 5-phosphate isomerase B